MNNCKIIYFVDAEIHAANESCTYMTKLIHEIGLELRSSAVCTGLRRIRYGHFTLTHALLTKHCDAQSIAENIEFCRPIVTETRQTRHSDIVRTDRQDDGVEHLKIDKQTSIDSNDDEDSDASTREHHRTLETQQY